MKTLKYTCFIFIVLFGIQKAGAQCSLFPFFSNDYNCITNQSSTSYTINGGVAPYTCTFVTGSNSTVAIGTTVGNTGSVTAMPVGSYTIYIMSANSCTYISYFSVTIPFSSANVAFTNTNVSCFGGSNGVSSVNLTTAFFTPPFTYTWTSGANTQTAGNLLANTIYSVTVQDSKGCTVTNSVSLTEPPVINSTITNTLVPCFGGTVSTAITSTGGVSPYTYSVNGVAVAGNTAAISAGNSTIVTKDNNGCLRTNIVTATQVAQPIISFSVTKPSCPGKTDGAISSTVTSAPSPLSYTWQPVPSGLPFTSGIPVGTYTLTVKDGSACITKSVVVVSPAASMSVTALTQPENCSAADGTATLNVSGGNSPFNYNTSPLVGPHSSNIINALSSGSYTTVIKDANNCLDTLVFNIGNLSTVSVSIANVSPVLCYNQCNGSVQLSVQNGVPPLTFSASNTPSTSSNIITNLCAGFYVVKVVDAIGCPATTTVNFPAPPVFSYSANTPATVCSGKPVLLQASALGGAGGYNYVWNPGNISGQAVSLIPSGTTVYSLNVYDANGCTLAPYQVTVNVSAPISINISSSNVGICPGTTAQVTPTVAGGDGNYSYTWQPGGSTSPSIFLTNVSVPVYTLSVNDGCGSPTAVKIIPINLFPVTIPQFVVSDTVGCEPFCAIFNNTTPKSSNAIWNYGDKPFELGGNTTNYCYQKAGYYNIELTVNDSNNCRASFTFSNVVRVLSSPKTDFTTNPQLITLNNAENVQIENTTINGSFYTWDINGIFMGNTEDITHTFSDTGCYHVSLIAKNMNGCSDTTAKFICVIEGFNFYMPNCITVNHDNRNDVLIPLGTGWLSDNYIFEVYNRWGSRIFKTTDITQGWDGKMNDDIIDPLGVYFWRINISDNIGKKHDLKGHVTVLR